MAAYGPKALQICGAVADGFVLQLADPDITRWMIAQVARRGEAGRSRPGHDHDLRGRAPTSATPSPTCETSAVGSVAWSATTSPEIVGRYGGDGSLVPRALTKYIEGRKGYDYSEHGRAGNPDVEFVPDEIIDRFCILGPVDTHLERLRELRDLGVDQFAIYLQHDDKAGTLEAYGEHIVPTVTAW